MENELISNKVEKKMITDLKRIINSRKPGQILLRDYIKSDVDTCMDFAVIYEASEDLRYFIEEQKMRGIPIEVLPDKILVLVS